MRCVFLLTVISVFVLLTAYPSLASRMMGGQGMGMMGHQAEDSRIQLNAPPMMKEHQKQMMREHLRDTQEVIALMGKSDFEAASRVAHEKLGLSERMRKMCGMFGNDTFRDMGLAFHESADELGEVLKTKDMGKSLTALGDMLGKCVSCHDTFRH